MGKFYKVAVFVLTAIPRYSKVATNGYELLIPLVIILSGILIMTNCGVNVGGGTGSSPPFPNDPVPSGTVVTQGSFTGQNGQTVNGLAIIYLNGSTYTLRIANFSAPNEAGLQVRVFTSSSSTPVCMVTLTYITGNKNYPCATSGGVFTNVSIYSTRSINTYGIALMQPPSQSMLETISGASSRVALN